MTVAFVFPGQGSQSVGMLDTLAEQFPVVNETYAEASNRLGYDLWQLVQLGPEEQLNITEHTQPALLAASVAVWRAWQERTDFKPAIMAGHSLGEYSALVCAGSLDFVDAVSLVAIRGILMQQAVAEGAGSMAAILGLEDEKVSEICQAAANGEVVAPANFNSPGQVVIAGVSAAVERAVAAAKEAGAKRTVILAVSVPSHCELMHDAAMQFKQELEKIELKRPSIPVLHNVDASNRDDPKDIRTALVEQLYQPVQWTKSVQGMVDQGVNRVIECGPGKVLSGLIKRIERGLTLHAISDPLSLDTAVTELNEALKV